MAETPHGRPRILRPGDIRDVMPEVQSLTREQVTDAELGLLRAQVRQLQSAFDGQRQAVNIHHAALGELTAAVAALQARTLPGRWRQFVAWLRGAGSGGPIARADREGTCPDCQAAPIDPANGVTCAPCWEGRKAW